jgi:transposase
MTAAERAQLIRWSRARTSPHRLVVRSRIVLMAAEGLKTRVIAGKLHVAPATVRLWCERFDRHGLAALVRDAPGRGRKRGMSRQAVISVLRTMLEHQAPMDGWTARSLATRAGTSAATVWRVWKRYDLDASSPHSNVRVMLSKTISETREDDG